MTKRRDDLLVSKINTAEELLKFIDLGDAETWDWLKTLERAEQTIQSAIRTGVEKARAEGATWQQVADVLSLNSRQAAEGRYGT